MTLKLVMIRCPDNVAPERREVRGGEFSIGRGRDNEWVIPDPERHLSKRHCRLVYSVGDWELHDLSANGTFLNGASDPVGQGSAEKLRNGDRIKFGLYEIEVMIDEDAEGAAPDRGRSLASLRPDDVAMREPLPARSDIRHYDRRRQRRPDAIVRLAVGRLQFADPAGGFRSPGAQPGALRGHATRPCSRARERLPPAPAGGDHSRRLGYRDACRPRPPTARPPHPPMPQEVAAPAPPRPEPAPLPPPASDSGLAAAFLRGVGLSEANLTDPEKTLERIGAAMRATVNGLRQTLMARASIKDEFRIEQTIIRASGNNPLKFSLDDDDALATLLGTGRRSGMGPEEAIAEAFNDLRLHELATVSAMQEAVRVLLAQFEPDSVERKVGSSALQIHPAQKKARAWDAFVQLHGHVTQALSDDFDSVFGKAFARAYEQAIDKLSSDGSSS